MRIFYVFIVVVVTALAGCASMSEKEQAEFRASLDKFSESQYREVYAYIKQKSMTLRGDGYYNPAFVIDHFFQGWRHAPRGYGEPKPVPFVQDHAFMNQVYADMDAMVRNAEACCHISHVRNQQAFVEIMKGRVARASGNAEQARAAEEEVRRLGRENAAEREESRARIDALNTAATSAVAVMGSVKQQNASAIASQQAYQAQRQQIERDNERYRELQSASAQQTAAPTPQANVQQEEIERLRRQVAALEAQQRQGASAPAAQVPAQVTARPPQQVAQDSTPRVESFWRNNVYHLRNNGSRRVMCQVGGRFARAAGIGPQTGLEYQQRAVVLFPGAEEAPFSGPVADPRFFDCRVM